VRATDLVVVAASAVVGLVAVLGGAFDPGPRLVVGILLTVVLATAGYFWHEDPAPEEWAVLGVLTWGVIGSIAVGGAPLAAREVLTTWLVAYILWTTARRSGRVGASRGLTVLAGAGLILALAVVFEAVGMRGVRVGGLLENPNIAAALLVVSVPALLSEGGRLMRHMRVIVALCLVVGVLLTGSRAGLLALLAAGATALRPGRWRNLVVGAGALGAAAVLAWRFVSQPDILAWYRPAIWMGVLKIWAAHPLMGVGPGGLADAAGPARLLHADHIGQHQFLIAYAESSPLAVLVQTGVVGVLLAALAAVLWARSAKARHLLASLALRAALVAMIVIGLFHDLLTVDVVLWWWAIAFGLLESKGFAMKNPEPVVGDRAARTAVAFAILVVMLWGVVAPSWARWLWSTEDRNVQVMERAVRAEPWYDTPLEWRVRALLLIEPWTWEDAAEALARSRHAVRIHSGAARRWGDLALVNARIVTDFGPWPDAVEGARSAFAHACELEPHLPWHWLEWARLERTMGDPEKASAQARRALAEEPNTVRAWLFLARLGLDSGRIGEAREALTRAQAAASKSRLPGLNAYERELLAAPAWQFRELEEALE